MSKPRRILSVGRSYVVALNRRLAHEMSRAGADQWEVAAVAPLSFTSKKELRPVAFERLPNEPCRVEAIPFHFNHSVHICHYGKQLKSIMAEGWDLVHCWEEPYVLVGAQVAWRTPKNTRLVFFTSQNISKRYPPPFNWFERYCLARCDGWVAAGQSILNTVLPRGYGVKPHTVIPYGVDLDSFFPSPDARNTVRKSLSWSNDGPPVVGYLGRFVPEKGLDLLMRTLDQINTPWRALLIGIGPMEAQIREWAARYGDNVRICTNVAHTDVPRYLNGMDMLVAPSQTAKHWIEQFGRMIVEASACGVPVIVSDSGEIPFVIGDAGLVIGEKDEPGWRTALENLLESPSRRQELGTRGRERAMSRYAWPVVARQYLDFFDTILSQKK